MRSSASPGWRASAPCCPEWTDQPAAVLAAPRGAARGPQATGGVAPPYDV